MGGGRGGGEGRKEGKVCLGGESRCGRGTESRYKSEGNVWYMHVVHLVHGIIPRQGFF